MKSRIIIKFMQNWNFSGHFQFPHFFRRFVCAAVFLFCTVGLVWGAEITRNLSGTYSNYNFDAEQGYIVNLSGNLTINKVSIYSTVTFNLNGCTLTFGSVEYGNSAYQSRVARITIAGDGVLYLGDVKKTDYTVSGSTFTVSGSGVTVIKTGTSYTNKVTINLGSNVIDSTNALTWNGSASTEWANEGNWTKGSSVSGTLSGLLADSSACTIIIPAGCSNYPVISTGNVTVGNLSSDEGTSLSISGDSSVSFEKSLLNGGTLTLDTSGNVSMNNVSSGSSSKVVIKSGVSLSTTASTTFMDVEIQSGVTFSPSTDFCVSGNWANSGTFNASAGTVSFKGSSQTVKGNNTWYNLCFSPEAEQTVTFGDGTRQKITNCLSFSGDEKTELTLGSDIEVGAKTLFNTKGDSEIQIHLGGHTIETTEIWMNEDADGDGDRNSNVVVDGSGKVDCKSRLDYPNKYTHKITVKGAAVLSIARLYGDGYRDDIAYGLFFYGDGNLWLPGSGANLDWVGNGAKVKTIDYSNFTGSIKAHSPPSTYTVSVSGQNNFSSVSPITITLKNASYCNSNLEFPYSYVKTGSETYKIDGTDALASSSGDSVLKLDAGSELAAGSHNHSFSTYATSFTAGDGFTICIKAPDGSGLILGSCLWYSDTPTWLGTDSSEWNNSSNWILPGGKTPADLSEYDVKIKSGCVNYPVISADTKVKNLSVESGASILLSDGTLLLGSSVSAGTITVTGDYKFADTEFRQTGGFIKGVSDAYPPAVTATGKSILELSDAKLASVSLTDGNAGGTSYSPTFLISGNSSTEIYISGALNCSGFVELGGNISAASMTFSSDKNMTLADNSKVDVRNSTAIFPKVSVSSSVPVPELTVWSRDTSNPGKIVFGSGSPAGFSGKPAVVLKTNADIYGANTFDSLVVEASEFSRETTVRFEAGKTQTVSKRLTVSGAADKFIKLCSLVPGSVWKINCTDATTDVRYAELQDSENDTVDAFSAPVLLYAFNGKNSGNNSWWAFPGQEYTWTGATSSDWHTASNWSPAFVPGYYTKVVMGSGAANNPVLSRDVDLKADVITDSAGTEYSSKITVPDGTVLDIADCNLTCGTLENKGRLRLKGVSGQNVTGSVKNEMADASSSYAGSEVEYYGANIEKFIAANASGKEYCQLLINGNVNLAAGQTVTAETAVVETLCNSIGAVSSAALNFAGTPLLVKAESLSINTPVNAGNFVFYKGRISVNAALSSEKDVVVLGKNYSPDDPVTGKTGILAYETARSAFRGYSADLDAGPYSAELTVGGGVTITAGKNFYANGTKLVSASEWYLKVSSNLVASNCFLEAYNTEVQNSKVICADGTSDGSSAQVAAENCIDSGGNVNWDFDAAEIETAYTLQDSLIYVKFNKPVRNTSGEILSAVSNSKVQFKSASSLVPYSSVYLDAACTTPLPASQSVQEFYLKGSVSWNTDATGASEGDALSTDRLGNHCSTVPVLDIPASDDSSLHILTDKFGRRIKNYGSLANGSHFALTEDKTDPVLVKVYTGQEMHDNPAASASAQEYYDSHNFLEFRYSEAVNIGTFLLSNTVKADNVNVRVDSTLGEITSSGSGITVAGLGTIASGALSCGTGGATSTTVHSLYRYYSLSGNSADRQYQTHGIRLSIAGYVDKTVSVDGNEYNHWLGYIESGSVPGGRVVPAVNAAITDAAGNVLNTEGIAAFPANSVEVSSEESGLYGLWDVYPPVFATYVSSIGKAEKAFENSSEIAGSCDSAEATVLNRMEFHVFDNDPEKFSAFDGVSWYTRVGWCKKNDSSSLWKDFSYAPDVIGGARPFAAADRRSSGGIRYSSIYDKAKYFKYSPGVETGKGVIAFDNAKTIKSGKVVSNSLFFPTSEHTGTENYKKIKDYDDNLYFGVYFTSDAKFSLRQTFSVSFDGAACVTDLAGNKMQSAEIRTIDSLDPKLLFTIAKVSGNELVFVVNKKLNIDRITVIPNDYPTAPKEEYDALSKMLECLRIINIDPDGSYSVSSDLMIDTSRKVQVVFQSERFTALKVILNRAVTFEDMQKSFLQVYAPFTSCDPMTDVKNSRVTFVQDMNGNYMASKDAHALSDFAVGVVNPVYAYDNRQQNSDGTSYTLNMYSDSSYAVHDWNESQKNYGTLLCGYDIFLNAVLAGCSSSSYPDSVSIYLDNSPDEESVSSEFNMLASKLNIDRWRLWLPQETTANEAVPVNDFLSEKNNSLKNGLAYNVKADAKDAGSFTFKIPGLDMYGSKWGGSSGVGWKSGDQISFLFSLFDSEGDSVLVYHNPQYNGISDSYFMYGDPFFSVRLKKEDDLTSLDLWSFRLKDIKNQRGGVTILNNVINASVGEKVTVKVEMEDNGPLNVVVMTLDGNVVQYLQHGTVFKGEHFYSWNGTTKSGKEVARGLYFVRVFGSGIDETRKVMVVKE